MSEVTGSGSEEPGKKFSINPGEPKQHGYSGDNSP